MPPIPPALRSQMASACPLVPPARAVAHQTSPDDLPPVAPPALLGFLATTGQSATAPARYGTLSLAVSATWDSSSRYRAESTLPLAVSGSRLHTFHAGA